MSKLDETVFVIENDEIVECKISDLDGYIDITTTPRGVAPRLHLRDNELWSWGVQGNSPYKIREFETEEQAQEALEDRFADDFWECYSITAFSTREAAEKCLAELRFSDNNE
jgi:hypothetical protein